MNYNLILRKTILRSVFSLLILALSIPFVYAEQADQQQSRRQITGTVIDTDGEPIIGANVLEKGTTNGISTDVDGNFTLRVSDNATLIVSFLGYVQQEIAVRGQSIINVTLAEDEQLLDELVVIGYGTMQRKQVTSSITSLSAGDLPIGVGGGTIANSLQGKIAGLVISGSSSPNAGAGYQLRGMASINTSRDPLIVIDGMPGGDLRTISPEEIQSIDVLKDASAGAIYGTRAAAGVILVTTKTPQSGKLRASYTGEVHFKQAYGAPDLLNVTDYLATYAGAKDNGGADVDWWDEALTENPTSNRHVVTLQGGSQNSRFFASLMYDDNKGVLQGDSRKDYSGRINGDFNLLNGWLDVSTHIQYRQADRKQNKPSIEGIMRSNPSYAIFDPDSQTGYNIWLTGDNTEMNEIGEAALKVDEGIDKWFRPDISLKLNILPVKGLSYRHTFAYEHREWVKHYYRSAFTREELRAGRKGYATLGFSQTILKNTDGYFSYVNDFGPHAINAVAGYSYYERNGDSFEMSNGNFTSDLVQFWNIGEGSRLTEGIASMSSSKSITQRLLAYFARANYSYMDKYMVSASFRREGSSKFAENNRWGNFWSISGGWRISNESFMQDIPWINDLKLRVGYGVTGNEGFDADYAATMYGSDTRWLMPTGNWAYAYGVTRNVNNMLGWEEKHELNLGLDFSLFNNRFYGKVDVYRRKVDGLIYNVNVSQPPYTQGTMYKNIGTMENKGLELELGGTIVQTKDWNYNTSMNVTFAKTKIGTLWGEATYMNGETINNWVQYVHRLEENVEVGSYFLLRYAGVSDDGRFQVYDKEDNIIFSDDAKIDDRVYMGNYYPKATIGWTHNVNYKNWSLSATLTSWIDFDIFNAVELEYGLRNVAQGNMTYDAIEKNAHITGRPSACDYFLYDGTFLKVQNLTLGYTLPMKKYTNNLLESAKLYFTANDLLTLTNYPGLNPQVKITGWDEGKERKADIYPQTRTFTFGLQLNF